MDNNKNLFFILGNKYKNDKVIRHGYHRFYNKELIEYQNMKEIGILEIGVANFESIDIWKEYFPYAFIYGIDINKEYEDARIKVYKTDQSDINNLQIIKDNLFEPPLIFDIIQQNSNSTWREMYEVFNMGCRIEIYCNAADAQVFIDIAKSFEIDAQIIGRVETSDDKSVEIHAHNEVIVY
jgi:hypothetical protein